MAIGPMLKTGAAVAGAIGAVGLAGAMKNPPQLIDTPGVHESISAGRGAVIASDEGVNFFIPTKGLTKADLQEIARFSDGSDFPMEGVVHIRASQGAEAIQQLLAQRRIELNDLGSTRGPGGPA